MMQPWCRHSALPQKNSLHVFLAALYRLICYLIPKFMFLWSISNFYIKELLVFFFLLLTCVAYTFNIKIYIFWFHSLLTPVWGVKYLPIVGTLKHTTAPNWNLDHQQLISGSRILNPSSVTFLPDVIYRHMDTKGRLGRKQLPVLGSWHVLSSFCSCLWILR